MVTWLIYLRRLFNNVTHRCYTKVILISPENVNVHVLKHTYIWILMDQYEIYKLFTLCDYIVQSLITNIMRNALLCKIINIPRV